MTHSSREREPGAHGIFLAGSRDVQPLESAIVTKPSSLTTESRVASNGRIRAAPQLFRAQTVS